MNVKKNNKEIQNETVQLSPIELEIQDLEQKISTLKNAIHLTEYQPPKGVVIESTDNFYQQLKAGLENEETRAQALKIKQLTIEEIDKLEPILEAKQEKLKRDNLQADYAHVKALMIEKAKELNSVLELIDPIFQEMEQLTKEAKEIKCKIKPYAQEPGEGLDQFSYNAKKSLFRAEIDKDWVKHVNYPEVKFNTWSSPTPALRTSETTTKRLSPDSAGYQYSNDNFVDARSVNRPLSN